MTPPPQGSAEWAALNPRRVATALRMQAAVLRQHADKLTRMADALCPPEVPARWSPNGRRLAEDEQLRTLPFGERLREYRERRRLSRPVLGGLVGRSGEWVKSLEIGRLKPPRVEVLIQLAQVLGLSPNAFIDLPTPEPAESGGRPW